MGQNRFCWTVSQKGYHNPSSYYLGKLLGQIQLWGTVNRRGYHLLSSYNFGIYMELIVFLINMQILHYCEIKVDLPLTRSAFSLFVCIFEHCFIGDITLQFFKNNVLTHNS